MTYQVLGMGKIEARRGVETPAFERYSFFEPEPVRGLSYVPDYITAADEAALLAKVDEGVWATDLRRRTQTYGWAYNETTGRADQASHGLPDWLKRHARRLREDDYFPQTPDRVSVNEYEPGQGIGAHVDKGGQMIETVGIISLGSAIMMDFTRPGYEMRSYYLRPRSLLLISGEARYLWMHGIAPRKADRVGGLSLTRGRRVSLMFRAVRPS